VGGFAGQYADIDRVSAHHGDNHAPLVARHFLPYPDPGGDLLREDLVARYAVFLQGVQL
jgi:hypothetical protein